MRCHVCNVAVGDGQQFCHECGESLAGVTDPTEPLAIDGSTDDDTVPNDSDAPDAGADLDTDTDLDLDLAATQPLEVSSTDAPLDSEVVAPPPVPETSLARDHAGTLPDLAAAGPSDEGWWDGHGAEPDPSQMPPPPTEAIDAAQIAAAVVPAGPSTVAEPSFAEQVATSTRRRPLDAIPDADPADSLMSFDDPIGSRDDSTHLMSPPAADAITDEFPPDAATQTTQMSAAVFDGATDAEAYVDPALLDDQRGFRLRAAFVLSALAMIATLMVSVADIIDIRTTRPVDGIIVGFRAMDDLGTNLAVAGFIGAATMLVGGLLSCFGLRWGAGLAGGSGLALVGWSAIVLGLAEVPIHSAQQVTRNAGPDVNAFQLSITRDIGWFLVLAIAALGLIVFVTSLRMSGAGGRRGLNPWIAAVGALCMVILAAGPLIPLDTAGLDANLGTGNLAREFFAARLIQTALLAVTGVLGFLAVRNYGLGFAAGGLSVAVWLWATAYADFGRQPVSIAVGNIGTSETTPHMVTTVGMTAALALLAVAATTSFLTRPRR